MWRACGGNGGGRHGREEIEFAQKLGLVAIDHASVETANGKCEAPIYLVDFTLPERNRVKRIKVMGTNLNICDALIGMDIITLGDLLVTNAPNTRPASRRRGVQLPQARLDRHVPRTRSHRG